MFNWIIVLNRAAQPVYWTRKVSATVPTAWVRLLDNSAQPSFCFNQEFWELSALDFTHNGFHGLPQRGSELWCHSFDRCAKMLSSQFWSISFSPASLPSRTLLPRAEWVPSTSSFAWRLLLLSGNSAQSLLRQRLFGDFAL